MVAGGRESVACIMSLGDGPAESISSSGIARDTSGPHCHCTIARSWMINSVIAASPREKANCSGVSSWPSSARRTVVSPRSAHLWLRVCLSRPSRLMRNFAISILPLDIVAWIGKKPEIAHAFRAGIKWRWSGDGSTLDALSGKSIASTHPRRPLGI